MPLWICDSGIVGCAAADKADRAAVAARRRILNVRTTGLTVLRGSAISGFVPVTSGWRFGIRDSRFGPTPESRVANPESRSLVTERFNRIQLRGLRRRINSEDHAQNRAEAEGDGDGPERRVHGRQLQQSLEGQARRRREQIAAGDADAAAEAGQDDGLDEELQQDVAAPRADGLADADLPRPLRHGDEHDVHDADAADEKGNADDRAHDYGRRGERFGDHFQNLLLRQHAEIVFLIFLEVVARAEDLRRLFLDEVEIAATAHLEGKDEAFHVLAPPDRGGGAEGDEDDVVAVLPEGTAFLLHHADDGEAVAVDLDRLAEGIGGELELFRDGLPDDADAFPALRVERGEEAAALDPVVEDVLIRSVDAHELHGVVRLAALGLDVGDEERRELLDRGRGFADGFPVLEGELRQFLRQPPPLARVGKDFDVVRPDALQILGKLVLHALHERDDRDDRRDADHHAENREDRAHLVGADGAEGDLYVFEEHFRVLSPESWVLSRVFNLAATAERRPPMIRATSSAAARIFVVSA